MAGAAEAADVEALRGLLGEIPPCHGALVRDLEHLLEEFRLDTIHALLESAHERDDTPG